MSNHNNRKDGPFLEYLTALNLLVGGSGRSQKLFDADAPFWLVAYEDVPDEGSVTAFTFGISSIPHPSWQSGVSELVISVNSTDDDWLLSLAAIACFQRGTCPFSYGNVLRFGKPLSHKSDMSAYFLFWPTILEKDQQQLKLSDRTITFKQAYPIYDSEADAIAAAGAEKMFMREGVDYTDVTREKVA